MKKLFILFSLLAPLSFGGSVIEGTYVGTNGYMLITNKVDNIGFVAYGDFGFNFNVNVGTNFTIDLTSQSGYTNRLFSGFSYTSRVYRIEQDLVPLRKLDVLRLNFSTNRDPALPYTNLYRYTSKHAYE